MTDLMKWMYDHYIKPQIESQPKNDAEIVCPDLLRNEIGAFPAGAQALPSSTQEVICCHAEKIGEEVQRCGGNVYHTILVTLILPVCNPHNFGHFGLFEAFFLP